MACFPRVARSSICFLAGPAHVAAAAAAACRRQSVNKIPFIFGADTQSLTYIGSAKTAESPVEIRAPLVLRDTATAAGSTSQRSAIVER
jgi:hypothetical protein